MMKMGGLIVLLGLASPLLAQAAPARVPALPACVTAGQGPVRVAFRPGQVPLRCARFLPTTSLHRPAAPAHT